MLRSAGRACCPRPHMLPTHSNPRHTVIILWHYRAASYPLTHTSHLMSCWVIWLVFFTLLLQGNLKGGVQDCSTPHLSGQGDVWTSVRVWGALPLWEAARSFSPCYIWSPWAVQAMVEGRATAEGFSPHWRAAEPTGKPTPASPLIDWTI